MILRRLGNKKKLAKEIQKYFPVHSIYIEPFFGAGGMFFNKPKAKHNIVNDLDSDVFNLFQVVMDRKEELKEAFYLMPIHSDLLEYWKKNKEEEPIKKALRFLLLSNFTFNGHGDSLIFGASTSSSGYRNNFNRILEEGFSFIQGVQFINKDFRDFFKSIMLDNRGNKKESDKAFIYSDPPYIGTGNNYSSSFTEEDFKELVKALKETKCKFAISEFLSPFIEAQAEAEGLNLIKIKDRQNLKNRRTEVLLTNYKQENLLF
jgi:DNA adenine methylase